MSGILHLFVDSRIGNWKWWTCSLRCCILIFPVANREGRMIWLLRNDGNFDVWSFYEQLRWSVGANFPWKSIWSPKDPSGGINCLDSFMGKDLDGGEFAQKTDIVDWCCICKKSRKLLITCYYIVREFGNCGLFPDHCLESIGWCTGGWLSYYSVGGIS